MYCTKDTKKKKKIIVQDKLVFSSGMILKEEVLK